jgi:solute carrier family 39 (zinc transporter), member 1/2/3
MASVFGIFIAEFFAFRIGTAYMERIGINVEPHGAQEIVESHTSHEHRPHDNTTKDDVDDGLRDMERRKDSDRDPAPPYDDPSAAAASPSAQIIGVLILEFGVIFHSIIIGLTLATSDRFTVLFIVVSPSHAIFSQHG